MKYLTVTLEYFNFGEIITFQGTESNGLGTWEVFLCKNQDL